MTAVVAPAALLPLCLAISLGAGVAGFFGFYREAGFSSLPPSLILGLQLAAGGIGGIAALRLGWRQARAIWPLVLFALWAAATAMWSDDPVLALRRAALINVPALLLALVAVADPAPQRSFAWFARGLLGLAALSAAFVVLVLCAGDGGQAELRLVGNGADAFGMMVGGRKFPAWGIELARYSGLASNPNGLALLAGAALVALAGGGDRVVADRRVRIVLFAGLAALLVLTLSRAAIVLVLVGLIAVVLLKSRRRGAAALFGIAILALPVLLMGLVLAGLVGDIYSLSAVAAGDPARIEAFDAGDRAAIWYRMLMTAGDSWPYGIGFGLTQEVLFAPLGYVVTGHSVVLTLLVETGLPGLLFALWAWFAAAWRHVRSEAVPTPAVVAVVALLLAFYAHQAFDASAFRYHWGHFVLAYLIGAALNARLAGPAARDA